VSKWRSCPLLSLSLLSNTIPLALPRRGPLYGTGARPYTIVVAFCVVAAAAAAAAGGKRRAARRKDTAAWNRWNKYSGRRWKRAHKARVYELPDSEAAAFSVFLASSDFPDFRKIKNFLTPRSFSCCSCRDTHFFVLAMNVFSWTNFRNS